MQELAREAAVLRRALEAAQSELLELRSEAASGGGKKGKGHKHAKHSKKKRGWFGRRTDSAASMASGTQGSSARDLLTLHRGAPGFGSGILGGGGGGGGGPGAHGDDGPALRSDGGYMVDPYARRYTRGHYKRLRTAVAAPTLQSCGCPLAVPRLLARVLSYLPFEEVRGAVQGAVCMGVWARRVSMGGLQRSPLHPSLTSHPHTRTVARLHCVLCARPMCCRWPTRSDIPCVWRRKAVAHGAGAA